MKAERAGEGDILLRKVSYWGTLPKNTKYFFSSNFEEKAKQYGYGVK